MIVYADGAFRPAAEAGFPLQERGVMFADGVYEVVRYDGGRPFGMQPHIDRLKRSLDGIGLTGLDTDAVAGLSDELVKLNGCPDCKVYWQVTRGEAGPRNFIIPDQTEPNLVLIAYPSDPIDRDAPLQPGPGLIVEDCRWTKCWIKSLMLLPASLAKTAAAKAGAVEAIFERQKPGTDQAHITEGGSTNLFIVRDGELHTHPDDGWILGGITRDTLIRSAREDLGLNVQETAFTAQELKAADEVFVCSTTQLSPVTELEGQSIGTGNTGSLTEKLHRAYLDRILEGRD